MARTAGTLALARDLNPEGRALARLGNGPDAAAVLVQGLLGDEQAEARAAREPLVEKKTENSLESVSCCMPKKVEFSEGICRGRWSGKFAVPAPVSRCTRHQRASETYHGRKRYLGQTVRQLLATL